MLSSLFFLTPSGEVLIEKQFREKIHRPVLEDFWTTYISPLRSVADAPTVVQYSRYAFINIVRDEVVLLGVTSHEVPPMIVVEILNMIYQKLCIYIKAEPGMGGAASAASVASVLKSGAAAGGGSSSSVASSSSSGIPAVHLSEYSLKKNFSLVYQLLEEIIDNGFPLTTEAHQLEELVPRSTIENQLRTLLDKPKSGSGKGSGGGLFGSGGPSSSNNTLDGGPIAWRPANVKYATNEIFLDVTEFLDVVVGAEGNVVRASVRGVVDCTSKLSGMPDVSVSFAADSADNFEDVAYHRCVRHARFQNDRTLSFVPPDGTFRLFQYRCKPLSPHMISDVTNFSTILPFYVNPQITYNNETFTGRINCMVGYRGKAIHGGSSGGGGLGGSPKSSNEARKEVHKLVVHIPLPPTAESITVASVSVGTFYFNSVTKIVSWRIGQLSFNTPPSFSAEVVLSKKGQHVAATPTTAVMGGGGSATAASNLTDGAAGATNGGGDSNGLGGVAVAATSGYNYIPTYSGTGEPVRVEFQIPNHKGSDVRIDSVNVSENYKAYKGVKYMLKGGRFSVRTV